MPFQPETAVLDLIPQQYYNPHHQLLVVDYSTREPMLFATLAFFDGTGKLVGGTETDRSGYATAYMPDEEGSIEVSYVGYTRLRLQVADIVGNNITIALQASPPESNGCFIINPGKNVLSARYTDEGLNLQGQSFRKKKDTSRQ